MPFRSLAAALLIAAIPAAAMAEPPSGRTAQGTGVVAAVDAKASTVTLKHDPIPTLGWPSMTMDFRAAPELVAKMKVGQKVAFDVKETSGGVPEITALRPR